MFGAIRARIRRDEVIVNPPVSCYVCKLRVYPTDISCEQVAKYEGLIPVNNMGLGRLVRRATATASVLCNSGIATVFAAKFYAPVSGILLTCHTIKELEAQPIIGYQFSLLQAEKDMELIRRARRVALTGDYKKVRSFLREVQNYGKERINEG